MPFNSEQLKALENPYEGLGDADKLAEHREQLNLLATEDKKKVAIKLVQQCPADKLNQLGQAIHALKTPAAAADPVETFHQVVVQVWGIRKKILALQDPRHPKPHTLLLEPEFDCDLFAEYNDFSVDLLDGNELTIAQKLAKTTPKDKRSELVRNIQNAFPDSQFVTVVGATFAFRRELDLLLGDTPYKFFTNPEFNAKAYVKYIELLELIDGKDEEIAAKLATTPNIKRHLVRTNMELMFPNSILLEKTIELFNTPAKETVHGSSIFVPASAAKVEPDTAAEKKEVQASFSSSIS